MQEQYSKMECIENLDWKSEGSRIILAVSGSELFHKILGASRLCDTKIGRKLLLGQKHT